MYSLDKITSLERPLDFDYSSNIFIVGLSFLAGIITIILYPHNLSFAASMVINTFLIWAIVRELAPIQPVYADIAAAISLGLALYAFDYSYEVSTLGLFIMLLLTRIVIQPVGEKTTLLDAVLVAFLILLHGSAVENTFWIIIGLLAFSIDWYVKPQPNFSWIAQIILSGGLIMIFFMQDIILYGSQEDGLVIVLYLLIGLGLSLFAYYFETRVVFTDNHKQFISKQRLFYGRLIATLCIISIYFEIFVYLR